MNNKKTAIILAIAVVILGAAYIYLSSVNKTTATAGPTSGLPDFDNMAGNLDEQTERQVQFKFPDDITVGSVNTFCEEINPESSETIVLSKAEEVGQCRKPHYQLRTKTPADTIESMIENYKKDAQAEAGNSHAFEIDDLATIYAYLLSDNDVRELEKLAQRNDETGATAQALLKTYSEARAGKAAPTSPPTEKNN